MSGGGEKDFRDFQQQLVSNPVVTRRKRRRDEDGQQNPNHTKAAKIENLSSQLSDERDEDDQQSPNPTKVTLVFQKETVTVNKADIRRDRETGPKMWQNLMEEKRVSRVEITVDGFNEAAVAKVFEILKAGAGCVPSLYKISRGTESLQDIIDPTTDMKQGQINALVKIIEELLDKGVEMFRKVFYYVSYIDWEKLMDFMLAARVIRERLTTGVTDISPLRTPTDIARVHAFISNLSDIEEEEKTRTNHQMENQIEKEKLMERRMGYQIRNYLMYLVPKLVDNHFIMQFEISQDDVDNKRALVLPYRAENLADLNGIIDWGDGTSVNINSSDKNFRHVYVRPDTYTVEIKGLHNVPFGFGIGSNIDRERLIDIKRWGGVNLRLKWGAHFYDCEKLGTLSATDKPDLRGVTSLAMMFAFAKKFNGDLSKWNVSSVTDMRGLFSFAFSFQGDISRWDVSRVTNMRKMFLMAKQFQSDLSAWDVSSVTDMAYMFNVAMEFTSDLSAWNVQQVQNMQSMFSLAWRLESNLSNWNVSKVTDMRGMFSVARVFSSDLSSWEVSKVEKASDFANDSGLNDNELPLFNADVSTQ